MNAKITLLSLLLAAALCPAHAGDSSGQIREKARRQERLGNRLDAAELFRAAVTAPDASAGEAALDLRGAAENYLAVDRPRLAEETLVEAVRAWPDAWRVLAASAALYGELPPEVVREGDSYPRREERTAPVFSAAERDRVTALRLMLRAEPQLRDDAAATAAERVDFYRRFLSLLTFRRSDGFAWRLTALTDLTVPPEPENLNSFWSVPIRNAPVNADGSPLYHRVPATWEAAANDGERMRWLLERMADADGDGAEEADWLWARFLLGQFGVQTMEPDASPFGDSGPGGESGPYAVRTLAEDETIARLATGIRRFAMPDEFNHIRILRRIARDGKRRKAEAVATLAGIFENRQQYPKALSFWRSLDANDARAAEAVRRIAGNNGVLEIGPVAPAGKTTTLSYLYRNGDSVSLTARRIDERLLLQDIRDALKKGPEEFYKNHAFNRPDAIGRQILEKNGERYLGEKVAEWEVALAPPADHFSARAAIELPFDKGGCYLVEATLRDGNTSRLVLWIDDLALVRKNAGDKCLFFVADAVTGEPAAGADLTFMGFFDNRRRNPEVFGRDGKPIRGHFRELAEKADDNGLIVTDRLDPAFSWLAVARAADGRLAYLGFDRMWGGWRDAGEERRTSAFIITDRPVYRPGDDVKFKVWLGRGSYTEVFDPENRDVTVRVSDPEGTAIHDATLTADAFGGVSGSFALGDSARLGVYHIYADGIEGGGIFFRLEEYRKPEFEVTLETPDRAAVLGEVVPVAVKAKYYFGAPVTDATVSYRVLRTPFEQTWNPVWRWDWLYGAGSWLPRYDYSWYPGWRDWSAAAAPTWQPRRFHQPEVVAEGEGRIGADGVFRLDIDTAPARELFGDMDHQYDITVEVRDASRRTIVGTGKAVASRKPFAVMAWTERGLFWAGDAADIRFQALRPLGGGVRASGIATLYRVRYGAQGAPSESEIESVAVASDDAGDGTVRFRPKDAGQYRVSIRLADETGNAMEGGLLLTVRGDAASGDNRFSSLELIADANEYAVGRTAKLAVNSSGRDAFVLFFPRAERGGLEPTILRLENGTRVLEVNIGEADQPNFFCEVIAVIDGKLRREVREIFVPPASRTLNIELSSDKARYAPGEKALFNVKATDANGVPVRGQLTIAIYDKAVEYISGGGNVGDIRAHFWGWKRHYSPSVAANLSRLPYWVWKNGDERWEPIGVFGRREADWNEELVHVNGAAFFGEAAMDAAAPRAVMLSAPAPSPAQAAQAAGTAARMQASPALGGGGPAAPVQEPRVRGEFADTALWLADLETDEAGAAAFGLTMPENLTAWTARVWGMASGTRVGEASHEVETAKNVIVRPQAPRFLIQKDRVVLSANLHNYLPRDKKAVVELVLEGGLLELADGAASRRGIELPANGEARVDWPVVALRPGEARIVMKLMTDEESDAAEITLPVALHGSRRVQPFGGILRDGERELALRFTVPEERLTERSRLELSFSPSIAAQLLDALPYLIDYPYGCTEQTLNRFLPAVMTRRYLDGLGLSLSQARPTGSAPGRDRPALDDATLDAMVRRGVERLSEMRNSDGGWGWFSGAGERSWPHTTAVVVHGLIAAEAAGVAIPFSAIDDGVAWLRGYQERQIGRLRKHVESDGGDRDGKAAADSLDAFVYLILVERGHNNTAMRDFLYRDRLELSPLAQCMLGLALHRQGADNFLAVVLANLRQRLDVDAASGAARLRTPPSGWWWWYNSDIETQAWYLQLLSAVEPRGAAASGLAKYVLQNRKNGGHWQSTRETAYCIQALIAYAVAAGEDKPDQTVTVYLDGKRVLERRLGPADLLADNRFVLEGPAVEAGEHELRLERSGGGNVYYGGGLDLFSLEDPIARSGGELTVDRAYYRLTRQGETVQPSAAGQAIAVAAERHLRERIPSPFDDAAGTVGLAPGDLVEVELTVVAKNDCEYLVFEDMKAAGLEPVELRSGYGDDALGAYVEYRDRKVVLFVRHLPRGTYVFSYRLRAETPGRFSALPTIGGGMYAADLVANSDEMKVEVTE